MDGARLGDEARAHSAFSGGYRNDIDGLRAIAVVAVMLFHARFWPFSGGFVGVDVFFVISGFLITSIIKKEIDRRDFSIAKFYERRIRRIFPALFLLLFAVTPAALLILLPVETARFGQSLLATAVFGANIFFWRNSGYFQADAERFPLLHTWSLAVEEQFYIFFPLFLLVLLKIARPRVTLLALLAVSLVSLAGAEWQLGPRPETVFYLLPTRAWELLLGAMLAVAALPAPSAGRAAAAGAIGLAAIGASIVLYVPQMRFPGLAALPPCAGAALVLYAGRRADGPIARALAFRPVSFVGKISYSLYLWHLPPLVLARIQLGRELTVYETLALLAGATAAAVLSYRFVETPFRRLGSVDRRWRAIGAGVAASAVFSLAGAALVVSHGLAARYPDAVVAADAAQNDTDYPPSCVGPNAEGNDCRGRAFDVLVWGDSHAAHYFLGLERRAGALGLTAQLQWDGGCPPVLDAIPVTLPARGNELLPPDPEEQTGCADVNRRVLDVVRNSGTVHSVVLAGAWDFWTQGIDIGTNEHRYLRDARQTDAALNVQTSRRVLREGLSRTVAELREIGVDVVLLGQVPDNVRSPSECVARARLDDVDPAACGMFASDARARAAESLRALRDVAAANGARVFDPLPRFCPGTRCVVEAGGAALYRDSDHLAPDGSRFVADALDADVFRAAAGSSVSAN
ncbi:MAG TPA: acyltransferase family protein [Gammaproteobacteria bacterium]|nr:acyltransferase family protein [Gammaproteobacteria bacterium]